MKTEEYQEAKKAALYRRRRLIKNDDGHALSEMRKHGLDQPEDFLKLRTARHVHSMVDTISYCSNSGFGTFRHNTRIGQGPSRDDELSYPYALIEKGTDVLETVERFCHANDLEIFWSMRMNDTHDHAPERFKESRLKADNPQLLMARFGDWPKYGEWSAVDYAHDIIRELAFKYVEEVCRNYGVDGVELDFFRHPVYFKNTSRGLPVEDEDREKMTQLIARIASMMEAEGRKRGKPFLLAVRTPDDAGYCRKIGLDIERWMRDGLVDIFIPSGYFRLNPWEYSVGLGHKYGVRVYPCLSDSRVGGGVHAHRARASLESYRARALNVWESGADGVYTFNLFDPEFGACDEMGDPAVLKKGNRVYFASYRGEGRYVTFPHKEYIRVPILNPAAPIFFEPGKTGEAQVHVGERLDPEICPTVKMSLMIRPGVHDLEQALDIRLNGIEAKDIRKREWVECEFGSDSLKQGLNTVRIVYRGGFKNNLELSDLRIDVNPMESSPSSD